MAGDPKPRVMRPRRPIPGMDPGLGRLSEMLLALLSQVTVIRERLDTVERLIEKNGLFPQREVDAYAPDAGTERARTAIRKRQIDKVMRPLIDAAQRDAEDPT